MCFDLFTTCWQIFLKGNYSENTSVSTPPSLNTWQAHLAHSLLPFIGISISSSCNSWTYQTFRAQECFNKFSHSINLFSLTLHLLSSAEESLACRPVWDDIDLWCSDCRIWRLGNTSDRVCHAKMEVAPMTERTDWCGKGSFRVKDSRNYRLNQPWFVIPLDRQRDE